MFIKLKTENLSFNCISISQIASLSIEQGKGIIKLINNDIITLSVNSTKELIETLEKHGLLIEVEEAHLCLPPQYNLIKILDHSRLYDFGRETKAISTRDGKTVLIRSYHSNGRNSQVLNYLEKYQKRLETINHTKVTKFIERIETKNGFYYVYEWTDEFENYQLYRRRTICETEIWSVINQVLDILIDLKYANSLPSYEYDLLIHKTIYQLN